MRQENKTSVRTLPRLHGVICRFTHTVSGMTHVCMRGLRNGWVISYSGQKNAYANKLNVYAATEHLSRDGHASEPHHGAVETHLYSSQSIFLVCGVTNQFTLKRYSRGRRVLHGRECGHG